MINACVIGWPIAHSRSPLIHGYWLKQYGIGGSYTRRPVEPAHLAEFISKLSQSGLAGCNVTLPHKEAVFGLVTPADASTERLGAVNTLFLRDGRAVGTNTDGEGFINSLRSSVPGINIANGRVMVLGAGGASLAVVNAILEQGASEVVVANRTFEKAEQLRQRFGPKVLPLEWDEAGDQLTECGLLVNTTSLGMKGQPEIGLNMSRLPVDAVVTDIVYTPLETPFLEQARLRGNRTLNGLGMLLHQGPLGWKAWFGIEPKVTPELRKLLEQSLT
jgi:shikimate dehydrogenase